MFLNFSGKCGILKSTKTKAEVREMLFSIELYRKYLYNSTTALSRSSKLKKLDFESTKMKEILKGIPSLFDGDESLLDKKDRTIYTLIKRDIAASIGSTDGASARDSQICMSQYFITSVINEIEMMREQEVA